MSVDWSRLGAPPTTPPVDYGPPPQQAAPPPLPPPPPADLVWFNVDGAQYGPFDPVTANSMLADGRFAPTVEWFRTGMTGWQLVISAPEYRGAAPPPMSASPSPEQSPVAAPVAEVPRRGLTRRGVILLTALGLVLFLVGGAVSASQSYNTCKFVSYGTACPNTTVGLIGTVAAWAGTLLIVVLIGYGVLRLLLRIGRA